MDTQHVSYFPGTQNVRSCVAGCAGWALTLSLSLYTLTTSLTDSLGQLDHPRAPLELGEQHRVRDGLRRSQFATQNLAMRFA